MCTDSIIRVRKKKAILNSAALFWAFSHRTYIRCKVQCFILMPSKKTSKKIPLPCSLVQVSLSRLPPQSQARPSFLQTAQQSLPAHAKYRETVSHKAIYQNKWLYIGRVSHVLCIWYINCGQGYMMTRIDVNPKGN